MKILLILLILACPFQALGADPSPWVRVDSIVATIEGVPVLESDILIEIDLGLLESSHLGEGFGELLNAYLNRMLILKEIQELGGFRLTAGQAEGAYQGYLLRYDDRNDYTRRIGTWGVTEEEVFDRLSKALLVSLYTESRIQFFVNILPSDIEKAYEEDRTRWGEATVYEVWDTIRSELMQKTFVEERDRWLDSLRNRYDLVVYKTNGEK